jgi:hypothetical protein
MGRILQWETVVMSRESAEHIWKSFEPTDPLIAFYIRKDLDTQDGHFVNVELPLSDVAKVKEVVRKLAEGRAE